MMDIDELRASPGFGDSRKLQRFVAFYAANIRSRKSQRKFGHVCASFMEWMESAGIPLDQVAPCHMGAYIKELTRTRSVFTVAEHSRGLRSLFKFLAFAPLFALDPNAFFDLLDGFDPRPLAGARDRALLAVICGFFPIALIPTLRRSHYKCATKSIVIDTPRYGRQMIRLHSRAAQLLESYMALVGVLDQSDALVFGTISNNSTTLSGKLLPVESVFYIADRRMQEAQIRNYFGVFVHGVSRREIGVAANDRHLASKPFAEMSA